MARIQIDKDYYINITTETKNHEARFDLHEISVDGKGNERESYKSIGHYSSVKGACDGIIRYMTNRKLSKKKIAKLSEYRDMLQESIEYMENLLSENFPK